jgi:hypothetical protein
VVLVQFIVVVLAVPFTPGVCVVVVPVAFGFVFVTGVPGTVVLVLGVVVDVVVVPLVCVEVVEVPLVVTVAFGLAFGFVVVALVPGGQFGILGFVVVLPFVGVVVWLVVGFGLVGYVCAIAGVAKLTTSPAMDARPRIARELMRLFSSKKKEIGSAISAYPHKRRLMKSVRSAA